MKKIFTLSIALMLSCYLFATHQNLLTITSNTRYPVKFIIDNRSYSQKKSNISEIVLRDITPGFHSIKIYKEKKNWYDHNRPGNNNQQLLYAGNIFVKKGTHVDIIINRFGKAFIDERQLNAGYYSGDEDDWNDNETYKQAINAAEFRQLKQTISDGNFESTRLAIAKQTISPHYFTALQVKELVGLFSFENSRLDIAKYAYQYCTDQQQYYILNDALSFSSSKEELAAFLQKNN